MTASAVSLSHMQGTWMFMSVKVQDADPHLHTVQDDLEALFWVGLYMIALYMPIPEATAIAIVDELFQSYTFRGGVPVGGDTKRSFLSGSRNFELEPSLESADNLAQILQEADWRLAPVSDRARDLHPGPAP